MDALGLLIALAMLGFAFGVIIPCAADGLLKHCERLERERREEYRRRFTEDMKRNEIK